MTPTERQALLLKRIGEFDKVTVDTNIKAGETQKFVFQFKGNADELESYSVKCKSCTTVSKAGGTYELAFTAPDRNTYAQKRTNGDTVDKYTSVVEVRFKDGEQIKKTSPNGELIDNPDKVAVSLQIRAV